MSTPESIGPTRRALQWALTLVPTYPYFKSDIDQLAHAKAVLAGPDLEADLQQKLDAAMRHRARDAEARCRALAQAVLAWKQCPHGGACEHQAAAIALAEAWLASEEATR